MAKIGGCWMWHSSSLPSRVRCGVSIVVLSGTAEAQTGCRIGNAAAAFGVPCGS